MIAFEDRALRTGIDHDATGCEPDDREASDRHVRARDTQPGHATARAGAIQRDKGQGAGPRLGGGVEEQWTARQVTECRVWRDRLGTAPADAEADLVQGWCRLPGDDAV